MRARRAGTATPRRFVAAAARLRWARWYRALRSAQPGPERSGGTRPDPQFKLRETRRAPPRWRGPSSIATNPRLLVVQHVKRVDVRAAPPPRRVAQDGDGEVQVIVARLRVAGVAHVADHLAFVHGHAFVDPVGIGGQVRVVV